MKKILLVITILFISVCCKAQETIPFPFQGGVNIMNRFFKDSVQVTNDIIQKKASGVVIFKFTADINGVIKKIIIYYADDYSLTPPLIEALKRSNHKWVIPDHEKLHDFIIQFSINFNPPVNNSQAVAADFYRYYTQRRPITSNNQVPLDDATLLPTVAVSYDLQ
ncbi:hypothetical protein SAMN05216490_5021 [Mucilaginibacter mallensis]|uniref:TonB protein C-terminal n=1 Tax=Mucilaginibacter mallensis TaxID=652787 RepID=A0A1H2CG63_MUCMA|nr:hypothetical protein [Mucilaginibacter mallensis]SDT69443.1 hypothetical protein SAMN05216490_5021 [Mucilaginibacter mallensis]